MVAGGRPIGRSGPCRARRSARQAGARAILMTRALVPTGSALQRLPARVGSGHAKRTHLTGELRSAERAHQIGLIDVLRRHGRLLRCARLRRAHDPVGDISRPRHGWVGIVASRGKQLRGPAGSRVAEPVPKAVATRVVGDAEIVTASRAKGYVERPGSAGGLAAAFVGLSARLLRSRAVASRLE